MHSAAAYKLPTVQAPWELACTASGITLLCYKLLAC